jgi:hypothetical protein
MLGNKGNACIEMLDTELSTLLFQSWCYLSQIVGTLVAVLRLGRLWRYPALWLALPEAVAVVVAQASNRAADTRV